MTRKVTAGKFYKRLLLLLIIYKTIVCQPSTQRPHLGHYLAFRWASAPSTWAEPDAIASLVLGIRSPQASPFRDVSECLRMQSKPDKAKIETQAPHLSLFLSPRWFSPINRVMNDTANFIGLGITSCQESQHNCPHIEQREADHVFLSQVIVAASLSSVAVSSSSDCSILLQFPAGSDVSLRVSYPSQYEV